MCLRQIFANNSNFSEICHKFAQIMRKKGEKKVNVLENLNIDDAIKTISSLNTLVSMRFHANVIGIKAEVNTIAINYDPKVQKLAEDYNLPLIELDDKDISQKLI